MTNPANITIIQRTLSDAEDSNLVKIVTGKKNCAIVRMESIAHLSDSIT